MVTNRQRYREKVSQMVSWGHWFALFNILLAMVLGCRYLFVADWPTTLTGRIYSWMSLVGHFSFLVFATYLLILFPLTFIVMSQRLMRFLSAILATAGMTLLLIDSEVFTRFHLHLNPVVWELVINPDQNETARDWQLMFISVPIILLIEMLFAPWSWQKLRSLTRRRHYAKPVAALFFASFIGSHLMYIWADANFYRPITMQRANLPLSYPMTARRFLEKHGLLDAQEYQRRLVELRKNKGMTETVAREQLEDNVVLGTLMLEQDEVDGLVSGAVHTTANTIRPPLQLIKTAPGSSLVSSVFFMLLPEQVYVYGDCAINPDPTAEQLAEIAIQSADSAAAFGIEPRVAMLSYSTGTSGAGSDVEKVREATRLAQEKRPDLMIDGPLQYDAAVMADVAKSKAPNSPVAGRATVFIFPDLNTGNTTYKAVQRSADLISIGPMLQGMRKPVNDLSRGALVDDIVYTIALTAIQSAQQQ